MLRRGFIALLLLAASGAASFYSAKICRADPPPSAEFRNGHWVPVTAPSTQPISEPALDEVERRLSTGQPAEARKLDLQWLKDHKVSPVRVRAVYLLAEIYYQLDDRILAFYHFDEVMDTWPESRYFYPALGWQFRIADDFLNGHKVRFLNIPLLPAEEDAVEMLFRIQQRSPGSPLAEKALLRTADYYFASSQFDLAADTYQAYHKAYPRSPLLPQVDLRRALCSLAQFRGPPYDPTPLIDARTQLLDVETAYPDLAQEENIAQMIEGIDQTLARKLYDVADYYRRTGDTRGAVYIWRYLILLYPDNPLAQSAAQLLAKMPPSALRQPDPQLSSTYNPPSASSSGKDEGPKFAP